MNKNLYFTAEEAILITRIVNEKNIDSSLVILRSALKETGSMARGIKISLETNDKGIYIVCKKYK
jgi:hypothetical protein